MVSFHGFRRLLSPKSGPSTSSFTAIVTPQDKGAEVMMGFVHGDERRPKARLALRDGPGGHGGCGW
jgi:hypothetical protein